jgi:2-methylfumaryl-CoA hydratase
VPDISLNAVANLGYADCRFLAPVYPGDTLSTVSEVIGLKENSNGKTGHRLCALRGINQHGEEVLSYVRWVMVRKRDENAAAPEAHVPDLPKRVEPSSLGAACPLIDGKAWDGGLSGSAHRFGDYAVGEKIDHVDGMTVEEAEHQLATRLYQNTAKVHFNQHSEAQGRFGRRLIYGGHVISLARALELQRARQCLPHRRHQRRAPRGAAVRGRNGFCLVRDPRDGGYSGTQRRGRAQDHDARDARSSVYGVIRWRTGRWRSRE